MKRAERRAKGLYWDQAWKLVEGCTKVSPGCDNCWSEAETYMRSCQGNEKISARASLVINPLTNKFDDTHMRYDNLDLPLTIKPPTVFAIWNDLFHEDVTNQFRTDAYRVMARCKQHTFLILTKRPELMAEYFNNDSNCPNWAGKNNIWHGTTVENQDMADQRIPHLLNVQGKRFLSIEPLLDVVNLMELKRPFEFHRSPYGWHQWLGRKIHAVLLGGESGKNARPTHPDYFRMVRDHCATAGIPFTFKQWGEWAIDNDFSCNGAMIRCGKKKAGRELDGVIHNNLPWDKEAAGE